MFIQTYKVECAAREAWCYGRSNHFFEAEGQGVAIFNLDAYKLLRFPR